MKKLALLLMVVAAWAICESQGQAQVGYVTYYQPVMAQPVAVVSPPPRLLLQLLRPCPNRGSCPGLRCPGVLPTTRTRPHTLPTNPRRHRHTHPTRLPPSLLRTGSLRLLNEKVASCKAQDARKNVMDDKPQQAHQNQRPAPSN